MADWIWNVGCSLWTPALEYKPKLLSPLSLEIIIAFFLITKHHMFPAENLENTEKHNKTLVTHYAISL